MMELEDLEAGVEDVSRSVFTVLPLTFLHKIFAVLVKVYNEIIN
jgi:hypothetical protein